MLRLEPHAGTGWPNRVVATIPYRGHAPLHQVFLNRKLLLLAFSLAGAILSGFYLSYSYSNYTSETLLVEDPRGIRVFGQEELTPPGQTSDVNTALIETQLRVLVSDVVLKQVIARMDLLGDPEFNGTEFNPVQIALGWVRRLAGMNGEPEPPEVVALRILQEKVRAVRADRGYVIQLRATAHDPDKAARLASTLAATYIAEEAAARRELARRAGQDMEDRLKGLAARVKQAEDASEAFKVANRLVGASGELVSSQELSALNLQLVAAQTRTSELKARAEQIQLVAKSGVIPDATAESIKSSTIASLRTQFAELDRVQADSAARLGPRHPDTISQRDQIKRLQSQINAELTRISSAARSDFERARTNEQALARSLQTLKKQALDVSQSLVRLRELERTAQASRTVYESYLSRSRELAEQQRVDTANVRIISPALPPSRPNGLPPAAILLAGTMLGLMTGGALAVLLQGTGRPVMPRAFN